LFDRKQDADMCLCAYVFMNRWCTWVMKRKT